MWIGGCGFVEALLQERVGSNVGASVGLDTGDTVAVSLAEGGDRGVALSLTKFLVCFGGARGSLWLNTLHRSGASVSATDVGVLCAPHRSRLATCPRVSSLQSAIGGGVIVLGIHRSSFALECTSAGAYRMPCYLSAGIWSGLYL